MSRTVLAGLLMCVLALVGCSALAGLADLQSRLTSAGYETQNINHNIVNGRNTLLINVTMPHGDPSDAEANEIAEIVWTTYPAEVDELVITINGQQFMDASAGDLTDRFGERPASLGAHDGGGTNVLLIVVILVVAALFTGLMVLLWRRGRRVPPPVTPPSYQQPPPA